MKFNSYLIAAAAILTLAASGEAYSKAKADETTAASDSRIVYSGRTLASGDEVSFDWSGVYLKVRFTGKGLAVRCSDTKANYFNIWVDKPMSETADMVIRTHGQDTTISLASGLGKGEHEVIMQKRTEGEQGTVTLHSFTAEAGSFLQASPLKERHIEFIGDSYTCGFGTENSIASDPFKPETENCNLTYAAIASRYFDADFTLVCHSGQGIERNYDEFAKGYTMVDRYSQTFDESKEHIWTKDNISTVPDLVVVYLGANDFSTDRQPSLQAFSRRYKELLGKIRSFYGEEVPVLCLAAKLDPAIFDYVKAACEASGISGLHFATMQTDAFNWDSDLGACYHPNYSGHRKMASIIIPYISTVTGWEMPVKAYR